MPGNGQAEPRAAVLSRRRGVGLREGLKQRGDLFGGHADAAVADAEGDPARRIGRFPGRFERDRTILGELAGVAEQVQQGLAELGLVGVNRSDVVGAANVQCVAVFATMGWTVSTTLRISSLTSKVSR